MNPIAFFLLIVWPNYKWCILTRIIQLDWISIPKSLLSAFILRRPVTGITILIHVYIYIQNKVLIRPLSSQLHIHSCPKLKLQLVLYFSSFVYNSSINEQKNMKLRENISYEMINWILYYCGFGNNL